MYEHLRGKKLLIIGSAIEEEIVKVAKKMGVYTIVVDNIVDRKIARAKVIADEAWDMSFFDTEAIVKKCKKAKVDGVFAGYGEFRVIAASRIAKGLEKPYYVTEEQIELTRNKSTFKKECVKYNIPVPCNYCEGNVMTDLEKQAIQYPVIVKPTDRSGRIGISICYDGTELDSAIELALNKSDSKTYIVEQYIKGTEFAAIYTLVKGRASLSCVNAKYVTKDQKTNNFLCDCAISPAYFLERFKEEIDEKLKSLLMGINLKDGVANFQGIITEKNIYVFEVGIRVNGNNDWMVIEKNNGINFIKMMIAHSLTGDMCDDLSKDNPEFDKYYCTLPIFAHGGKITKFDIDKVIKKEWATISNIHAERGSEITEDGTNRQKIFAFLIEADDLSQLKRRIHFMQQNIFVENQDGINMLFTPFDTDVLEERDIMKVGCL